MGETKTFRLRKSIENRRESYERHSNKRLSQRFGLKLTKDAQSQLVAHLRNSSTTQLIIRKTPTRYVYKTIYQNKTLFLVFDSTTGTIVTALLRTKYKNLIQIQREKLQEHDQYGQVVFNSLKYPRMQIHDKVYLIDAETGILLKRVQVTNIHANTLYYAETSEADASSKASRASLRESPGQKVYLDAIQSKDIFTSSKLNFWNLPESCDLFPKMPVYGDIVHFYKKGSKQLLASARVVLQQKVTIQHAFEVPELGLSVYASLEEAIAHLSDTYKHPITPSDSIYVTTLLLVEWYIR